MTVQRRGHGGRTQALYVSKRLFEAVFGPWKRDEGHNVSQHSNVHSNPDPRYQGYPSGRRGDRYAAPTGRTRKVR